MKQISLIFISALIGAGVAYWPQPAEETKPASKHPAKDSQTTSSTGSEKLSHGAEDMILALLDLPAKSKVSGYAATLSALLEEPESMSRAIRISQIVGAWEMEDPLACLKFLAEHHQEKLLQDETWLAASLEDPRAVWAIMKQQKGDRHLTSLLGGAFENDPALAAAILAEASAKHWNAKEETTEVDAPKFANWLLTQPTSATNMTLRFHLLAAWSKQDPGAAADWHLQHPNAAPIESDRTATALINARPDGFVAQLPKLEGRISTFEQLASTGTLSVHRPAAVADFINNMAPSPTRITLAWNCVGQILETTKNPADAVAFAQRLESGGARLDALAQAFHEWKRDESADQISARQAALDKLSPEEQAYVEKHSGNMPGVAAFLH